MGQAHCLAVTLEELLNLSVPFFFFFLPVSRTNGGNMGELLKDMEYVTFISGLLGFGIGWMLGTHALPGIKLICL